MIKTLILKALFTSLTVALLLPLGAQRMEGLASFYADRFHNAPTSTGEVFKNTGYMAASKELPYGTIVEVTNVVNGKKVNVRINDCGPNRPDRVIDLSKAAARSIDLLKAGIGTVKLRILISSPAGPTCYRSKWAAAEKKAGRTRQDPPAVPAGFLGPVTDDRKNQVVANSTQLAPPPPPTVGNTTKTPVTYSAPAAPTVAKTEPPAPTAYGSTVVPPTPEKEEQVFGPDELLFGVQIAAFGSSANAKKMETELKSKGFSPVWSAKAGKYYRVFAGKFYFPDQANTYKGKLREAGYGDAAVRRVQ